MKIVLAPDSFKGSLTALQVCQAMAKGIRRVLHDADLVIVPMADGGEGTVTALCDATGGRLISRIVTGPMGEKVEAVFGILADGKRAIIEMAAASGLPLVPFERRSPGKATTYGTGELILAAIAEGCTDLLVGLGGSATNDGGAGMAQALGYRLLDKKGRDLPPGGLALIDLDRIEFSGMGEKYHNIKVTAACDVNNPLTGLRGAAAVYGPQKGATPPMVQELDAALERFSLIVKRDLGVEVGDIPGAGAAGGLGAGLIAFLKAELKRGVEMVIEATQLKEKMQSAQLIITGEGQIDGQSVNGKTPMGVAAVAKTFNLPVLAVAGGLGSGSELVYQHGIDGMVSIVNRPMTLAEAMENAEDLMIEATERMLRIYLAGGNSR